MRIVSVGGGPAGLGTAILAARQGHEVTVHDRCPRGETYGWGVVFWDGLIEELAARDEPTARAVRAAAFRWQDQLVAVAGADRVRIPGSGWLKPDGSDVAVQAPTGKLLPHLVLSHDPLGDTIVQFERGIG